MHQLASCAHQDKVKLFQEYLYIHVQELLFFAKIHSAGFGDYFVDHQDLLVKAISKRLRFLGEFYCLKSLHIPCFNHKFAVEQRKKEKHTFARRLLFGQADRPVSQSVISISTRYQRYFQRNWLNFAILRSRAAVWQVFQFSRNC